jgi:rhodanese-related sulfurtransferase
VEPHSARLSSENALPILRDYDLVVDGSDNFSTRYLVNDACVLLGKPNVYGSVFRFEGQVSVFDAARGPCYRCLYPEPPPPGSVPSCAEGGVLGVLPGIIGTLQANEAVKLLLGIGRPLIGRLVLFDALAMQFREVRLGKDPRCPICGENPTIGGLIDYDAFCSGEDAVEPVPEIAPADLARSMDTWTLVDVREPFELEIARIPGARHIPLGELADRIGELDRGLLLDAGFPRVRNLAGGILGWADAVDPTLARY